MNRYSRFTATANRDHAGYKHYRTGTHPTIAPADTVTRLRSLMPKTGITRLANVTGLDRIGVPVIMVCRPNSRSIAVSQGKGLTVDAAKASGLMDFAETRRTPHGRGTHRQGQATTKQLQVLDTLMRPCYHGYMFEGKRS